MRCTVGRRKPSSRRASPTRMADRRPSSRASASRTSRRPRPVSDDFGFLLLLLSNGIMIGLMYTLIALGFVLVYKATDAVNFAQGEFVMIAGLVVAGALDVLRAPLWAAILIGLSAMVAFGFALERIMLRRLIGRPVIAVVMATIGLASRSEEHTSELQSPYDLVCRLLLEKKKNNFYKILFSIKKKKKKIK